MNRSLVRHAAILLAGSAMPAIAHAQTELDRADPLAVEESRPAPDPVEQAAPPVPLTVDADTAGSVGPAIQVGAVRLEGLEALSQADFIANIAPYLGRSLDRDQQRALIGDIVRAARDAGYPLTSAMIEPQSLTTGILRVRIDEGHIQAVRLLGDRHALAERMLAPLANGAPVTAARLERALRLAETLPGVRVRKAELVQEGQLNILAVTLNEDRTEGRASIDNWGSASIGPVKLRARLEHRSVLTSGDEIAVLGVTTPIDLGEYGYAGLRYDVPVNAAGTRLDLVGSVAGTDSGGALADRDYEGGGARASATLSHPLLLRQDALLRGGIGLSLRDTEIRREGLPLRDDRVSLITARLSGYARIPDGFVSAGVALVHGPGWFGGTREGDPLASRDDGDARFTKVELRAAIESTIAGPVSFALDSEAQFASRPLLFGDEFGIGGARFGRGYDYREASGDNGIAGSAELRLNVAKPGSLLRRLQLYGYGDAAHVWDLRGGDEADSLYSAGGGVRATVTPRFGFGVEMGVPLGDSTNPRGSFEAWLRF